MLFPERLVNNFLLFIDPTMKAMYQVDVAASDDNGPRQIHGIDLTTSSSPSVVGYDMDSNFLYWHDDGPVKNSIKLKLLQDDSDTENSLAVFSLGSVGVFFRSH